MSQRSGSRGGYRTRAQRSSSPEVIVPEEWYDSRVVWCANEPRFYEKSRLKDEPFRRYSIQFGIISTDGQREKVYCSMPWPMDEVSFSAKSAVWTLANCVMGEGWMEAVTDGAEVLDTSKWLGRRLQVYPTIETYRNKRMSRVRIDTYHGTPHIRVAREVDLESTRLLWEKARGQGATQDLMAGILREFDIPSPDPEKWLRAEQMLVNQRLREWSER